MPVTISDVRKYYDRNTPLFLRFGSTPSKQTIHRSLWPPGVRTLDEALAVSNERVLDVLRRLDRQDPWILDLGCGVGATLFHLLAGLGRGTGVGITLSAVQAGLAAAARDELGLTRASFLQGDFHQVPLAAEFDLVYSIEALVHAQDPVRYLTEACRLLAPKGRLVILDDFQTQSGDTNSRAWMEAYREGWYVPNLQTSAAITARAQELGLTRLETADLTPLLRLRALPDPLARVVLHLGRRLPFEHPIVPSMLGSLALQQCLKAGWIEYRWLVFEKS